MLHDPVLLVACAAGLVLWAGPIVLGLRAGRWVADRLDHPRQGAP